jgi:hypothetical protein
MAVMEFSLRLGETIDLYDVAFRDSTLARLMFSLLVGDDHGTESNRLTEWGVAPEVSQWQRVKNCLWRVRAKRTFNKESTSAK